MNTYKVTVTRKSGRKESATVKGTVALHDTLVALFVPRGWLSEHITRAAEQAVTLRGGLGSDTYDVRFVALGLQTSGARTGGVAKVLTAVAGPRRLPKVKPAILELTEYTDASGATHPASYWSPGPEDGTHYVVDLDTRTYVWIHDNGRAV